MRDKTPNNYFTFSNILPKFIPFLFFYITLSLFGSQINSNYYKFKQNHNNSNKHITYGNISKNGSYKFATWNKGNSNFDNKIDDIKIILTRIHTFHLYGLK